MKTLFFHAHGAIELRDSNGKRLWSSDADENFADEFDDVVNPQDDDEVDEVCDYLIESGDMNEDEEFNIEEEDLEDFDDENDDDDDGGDDDNVIEGKFERVR